MSGKVDRGGCPRGAINNQQYQLATITVSLQKSRICSFSLASKTFTIVYLTLNSQILFGKLPATLMLPLDGIVPRTRIYTIPSFEGSRTEKLAIFLPDAFATVKLTCRKSDETRPSLAANLPWAFSGCKGRSHMYRLGSPIVYQSGEPWVLRAA
jgi:hypothetical protein